jgi:hypothetical protein
MTLFLGHFSLISTEEEAQLKRFRLDR